ncbi:MAG: YraN family protein [Nitrososphaerales archaeon]
MTDTRKSLGRLGESLACEHLVRQGWTILGQNWRTRSGEIDIVARDGDWLVFVEVRTRRANRLGGDPYLGRPDDSVTPRKQLQLARMAEAYLYAARSIGLSWKGPWRIDVVALELAEDGAVARLAHYRDAVGG